MQLGDEVVLWGPRINSDFLQKPPGDRLNLEFEQIAAVFLSQGVVRRADISCCEQQSVTSRLETSRYRDFSQFFESIGLGLENFGLEKKSRYRSR